MKISTCTKCSRIQAHLKELQIKYPSYFCKPIAGKGNFNSSICVFGLAPGLHGANRTGIPFTGDFSGKIIRNILDRLSISNIFITNIVRCYPYKNKPLQHEINNCHLNNIEELSKLKNLKVIITLGELAYRQILKIYSLKYNDYKFKHGRKIQLSDKKILLSSYHCSRININTGRLKKEALTSVFKQAKIIVNEKRVS